MATNLSEILQLSVDERIQLAEDIWESIAAFPESVHLTSEQQEELDRRLQDHILNPHEGILWADLKNRLLNTN